MWLLEGMFGPQPHFAKPKFDSHSLVFATLWLATFYCRYGSFVVESIFFVNFCQSLTFVFSATLCGLPHFNGLPHFDLAKLVSKQRGPSRLRLSCHFARSFRDSIRGGPLMSFRDSIRRAPLMPLFVSCRSSSSLLTSPPPEDRVSPSCPVHL